MFEYVRPATNHVTFLLCLVHSRLLLLDDFIGPLMCRISLGDSRTRPQLHAYPLPGGMKYFFEFPSKSKKHCSQLVNNRIASAEGLELKRGTSLTASFSPHQPSLSFVCVWCLHLLLLDAWYVHSRASLPCLLRMPAKSAGGGGNWSWLVNTRHG